MPNPKESITTLFTTGIQPYYLDQIHKKVDALGANAERAHNLNPDPSKERAVQVLKHCSDEIDHVLHPVLDENVALTNKP